MRTIADLEIAFQSAKNRLGDTQEKFDTARANLQAAKCSDLLARLELAEMQPVEEVEE